MKNWSYRTETGYSRYWFSDTGSVMQITNLSIKLYVTTDCYCTEQLCLRGARKGVSAPQARTSLETECITKYLKTTFAVILCRWVLGDFICLSLCLMVVHALMLWKMALNIWSLFNAEGLFSFLMCEYNFYNRLKCLKAEHKNFKFKSSNVLHLFGQQSKI